MLANRPRNYHKGLKSFLQSELDGLCGYCGVKAGDCIDHVDPNGPDHISNYMLCCRGCNSSKGRADMDTFRFILTTKEFLKNLDNPPPYMTSTQLKWLVENGWCPQEVRDFKFYFEKFPSIVDRVQYALV